MKNYLQTTGLQFEPACEVREMKGPVLGKYIHEEQLLKEEILVVNKLGILFLSYKVEYWYWEIFEMFRRLEFSDLPRDLLSLTYCFAEFC